MLPELSKLGVKYCTEPAVGSMPVVSSVNNSTRTPSSRNLDSGGVTLNPVDACPPIRPVFTHARTAPGRGAYACLSPEDQEVIML